MNTSALRNAIMTFHTKLDQRQQMRRTLRIQKTKAEQDMPGDSLAALALSPDVKALFDMVLQSVTADRQRYWLDAPRPQDQATPATDSPAPPPAALQPPNTDVPAQPAVPAPHLQARQIVSSSVFLSPLSQLWHTSENIVPAAGSSQNLSLSARNCLAFMLSEFNLMSEELAARGGMTNALMSKLKQAIHAYSESRITDSTTLIKNALTSDPHNPTLLAILSQIFYQLAATGLQTALPEARENAQRSIIHTEKIKPNRLALYRYMAMAAEREFGPERALEWLRDTGFLSPSAMNGKNGFLANQGLPLRGWALLSTIHPSLWTESEFDNLYKIVDTVVGGGAMYLAWFRTPLLEFSMLQKAPPAAIMEIERLIRTSHMFYAEIANNIVSLPLQVSPYPWFLRIRFLNTIAQICPAPSFDQVLCMIALDGLTWKEDVFPDAELRATLNDLSLGYWKLWNLAVTPHRDIRQPYLLPAEETVSDAPLLEACDGMLKALKEAESQRIRPTVWEDLKPWMVHWQIDHLLAAGSGSNKPRTRFAPNLVPYTHFYRNWQDPVPVGILASDIIIENAKRGAFASLFEIAAAFEGALRILDDPVHGLIAGQKRALQAAKQHNPRKFANVSLDFGGMNGGKVMMGILPIGLIGAMAAIIQMSSNWSQAAGLMLALAGFAGVIYINISKK